MTTHSSRSFDDSEEPSASTGLARDFATAPTLGTAGTRGEHGLPVRRVSIALSLSHARSRSGTRA